MDTNSPSNSPKVVMEKLTDDEALKKKLKNGFKIIEPKQFRKNMARPVADVDDPE